MGMLRLYNVCETLLSTRAPCIKIMSKFEYADDAALVDDDAVTATDRVTAIASGSLNYAACVRVFVCACARVCVCAISRKKSKAMHMHMYPTTRASEIKEAEVVALKHVCDSVAL